VNDTKSRVTARDDFIRSTPSTGTAFIAQGTGLSAASYNYILSGGNDTGNKLVLFVNGSTRTLDGGASNVSMRNDGGSLILGNTSFPTIVNGSNVGIGTVNPAFKLHVVGSSGSSAVAKFSGVSQGCYVHLDNDNAANQVAIQFNRFGTLQWINYVPGSSTDLRWYNSADRMTLTSVGALTCANDITAFSDRRHKTNIKRIENSLDKVSLLNGYTFNRTDEDDKTRLYVGVVAQEVLEVLPEVVHKNHDGVYSVAYGNLTALLIEALKEERQKREALETRVVRLEKLLLKE
jgi:hypothetical protein